jgi:hypothetical protein
VPANLDTLRQQPLTLIAPATQALADGGSISAWRKQMERAIRVSQTAAYLAAIKDRTGVIPKGLSKAERAELQTRIDAQLKYLDGFVADLRTGNLSPAQAAARAAMYAGANRGTYYAARFPGLPFWPGDGTECMSNCKCNWEQKGQSFYWVLSAAEHCPTCQSRAAGSPYTVEAA